MVRYYFTADIKRCEPEVTEMFWSEGHSDLSLSLKTALC